MLDPARFQITAKLEARYPELRAEAERVPKSEYLLWPLRDGYAGEWLVHPFFMASCPPPLPEHFDKNCAACPRTVEILRGIPEIRSASYSRMEPGCHIYPHLDHEIAGILRLHLGLITNAGSKLRNGTGELGAWEDGKVLFFDGQIVHETANLGSEPRTVLLIDFELTPREQAYVLEERARSSQ